MIRPLFISPPRALSRRHSVKASIFVQGNYCKLLCTVKYGDKKFCLSSLPALRESELPCDSDNAPAPCDPVATNDIPFLADARRKTLCTRYSPLLPVYARARSGFRRSSSASLSIR